MEVFFARIGLTARGLVYLLMGVLALLSARGAGSNVDQQSALAQIVPHTGGRQLLLLIAIGFAFYALWRFYEAAFGVTRERSGAGPRIVSLIRGLAYVFLARTAFSLYSGSSESQSSKQQGYAAEAMSRPAGRIAVAVVGVALLLIGLHAINEAIKIKFMRYFPSSKLSGKARDFVRTLGRLGIAARGFVFGVTGILLVVAAKTHDPSKASGLDAAFKSLRHQPFGSTLLTLVAIGLILFGFYGLAEARYRYV